MRSLAIASVAWGVLLLGPQARAQAVTCRITSVTSLAFGNYNVYSAAPLDSAGTLVYDCGTANPAVGVAFSPGSGGSFNPRRMVSGANRLDYNIFVDAARTTVWTSVPVVNASQGCQGQCGNGVYVSFYGRIYALQDAAVGTYGDSVTVTINF